MSTDTANNPDRSSQDYAVVNTDDNTVVAVYDNRVGALEHIENIDADTPYAPGYKLEPGIHHPGKNQFVTTSGATLETHISARSQH